MKTVFFIPVWNQIQELPKILEELSSSRPACDTVLLVNNGSDDGSETLVRQSGFPYIDLPKNLGIGYSFAKAIDWAIERRFDVFGVMAANGKMLPSEMGRLLEPICSGKADYVLGSRFMKGGDSPNLPFFRRHTIPWINTLAKVLTGASLTDATCGYRAFKLDIMKRAGFDWHAGWLHSYGLESYLLAKVLLDKRIRWVEVPVTMRYPKAGRYSKIRPVVGWFAMVIPWLVARIDGKKFCND
jgi:dolichol-phosphate mannosyltransferase